MDLIFTGKEDPGFIKYKYKYFYKCEVPEDLEKEIISQISKSFSRDDLRFKIIIEIEVTDYGKGNKDNTQNT